MTKKTRAPAHVIRKLHELRRNASLESASFAFPGVMVRVGNGVFENNSEPQPLDTFVKERTRVHRESWILPQLDALIQWAEGDDMPFDWQSY